MARQGNGCGYIYVFGHDARAYESKQQEALNKTKGSSQPNQISTHKHMSGKQHKGSA